MEALRAGQAELNHMLRMFAQFMVNLQRDRARMLELLISMEQRHRDGG